MLRLLVTCLAALAAAPQPLLAAERTALASAGDAYVVSDAPGRSWAIGNNSIEVGLGFDGSGQLIVLGMLNRVTGLNWDVTPAPDVSIVANGEPLTLKAGSSLTFTGAAAERHGLGVRLTFTYQHVRSGLRFQRSYACYPGSPTIEVWTKVDATAVTSSQTLSGLVAWQLTVPLSTVKWLGGLRGDSADAANSNAFELTSSDLDPDERIDIGGDGRSSEFDVPFALVDRGDDEFYGGLMWSGAWRISFHRVADDRLQLTAGYLDAAPTIAPGSTLEIPHGFFGTTAVSDRDESGALHRFIVDGIRGGRGFQPLVTYNSWFPYGARISEENMVDEMRRAAALGIELFVLDAGWWVGAGTTGDYDYTTGLGSWAVDTDRFPSGLPALADEAHGAGMKFGLWVEPERVDLATVDQPGNARESWLARHDGSYGSDAAAQICLVSAEARRWLLERLVSLIENVRPDYLKWDNNFWINCNRPGHGHGASDGNFAHVQALYAILAELKRRYPDLLIENVSGGGNRLDFGMLAFTDTAWMDDRRSPSTQVSHNLEGLTFAFPPAYLLSFVIDSEEDPLGGGDIAALVRSRMPGVLGVTYHSEELGDADNDNVAQEIARYKQIRDIVTDANASLLSAQAPVPEGDWDVLQEVADDRRAAVIFAFKSGHGPGEYLVRPQRLTPDVLYDLVSLDRGVLGAVAGAELMRDGILLRHDDGSPSLAHVVVLVAR